MPASPPLEPAPRPRPRPRPRPGLPPTPLVPGGANGRGARKLLGRARPTARCCCALAAHTRENGTRCQSYASITAGCTVGQCIQVSEYKGKLGARCARLVVSVVAKARMLEPSPRSGAGHARATLAVFCAVARVCTHRSLGRQRGQRDPEGAAARVVALALAHESSWPLERRLRLLTPT